MTANDAYHILDVSPNSDLIEIKKQYRKLMLQAHPDSTTSGSNAYPYTAQEINRAYDFIKKHLSKPTIPKSNTSTETTTKKKKIDVWNAPVNKNAFRKRNILQYAEDSDGSIMGNFCVATGKYLWIPEEDFPLFLRSIYQCSKEILDEIDETLHRNMAPDNRHTIQAELAYLLAQQYIGGTSLLAELSTLETANDSNEIFYIPAMLELSLTTPALKSGESLHPCAIRQHRLYLKNTNGQEVGYLSFSDDRLYYAVIPLFEQRIVQIKIQIAEPKITHRKRQSEKYLPLHLWIKVMKENLSRLPDSINIKIEQLLQQY